MKRFPQHRKIGAGHTMGMLRLGFSEIRSLPYNGSNIAQPTEYGIFGRETPGEIAESRRSDFDAWQGSDPADIRSMTAGRDTVARDRKAPDFEME
jgi:hypothetical protein